MQTRADIKDAIKKDTYDLAIIGGGASGLGVAFDAVSRGLKIALIEREDFGSGTSSKSTKLVHGGVRYLAQGHISLVFEALRERAFILKQAAHISGIQKFIIPIYSVFDAVKYYVGLKIYDILALTKSLGPTKYLSRKKVVEAFPTIAKKGLICGIEYTDGWFDDARLCIDLVHTISKHGGSCLNYTVFEKFIFDSGKICGLEAVDTITGEKITLKANIIVNCTGVNAGKIMEASQSNRKLRINASQGSHLVVDGSLSPSGHGLMIPKTSDGRVLFAIPWKNKSLIGTTDIEQKIVPSQPTPSDEEINFILQNLNSYTTNGYDGSAIVSKFAGLRPLAAPLEGKTKSKEISRSHKVIVSSNRLVSLIGGKWTTFRKMGYDTIEKLRRKKLLQTRESQSDQITIEPKIKFGGTPIHKDLPYSIDDIKNVIEHELVERLDDVLSRRTRCTFIDLRATKDIHGEVLEMIAKLKNWDEERKSFEKKRFEEKYFI